MGNALLLKSAVGGVGGKLIKLWENPSPNSTFSPQTINLDLSQYNMVVIYAKRSTDDSQNNGCLQKEIWFVGTTDTIRCWGPNTTFSFYRNAKIDESYIQFYDGHNFDNVSNSNAIPLNIYGIK